MDRTEDDMKLVGFFGIFKQSFKTIFTWKKIFAQITLAFILPLAIVFIVQMEISHHFFWKIDNNTLPYDSNDSREASALDWLYYALFTIAYYAFLTFFSVLSTVAVVFTIASIYTTREVVFRSVMKVIRKVIFDYSGLGGVVVMLIILIFYVYGFLYLSVICQLASVVAVLENIYGFNALKKGKDLTYGKKKVGMGLAFVLYGVLVCLIVVYVLLVEYGHEVYEFALVWRVVIGILCGILLLVLFFIFIVTQTVLYLVCKSYHREVIDKLSLSTFLGAYTGETVVYPRPGAEIQLGSPQPPCEHV
ncbi:hypothetical protein HanHA300_Chr05g0192881 [Helianthus annuus]|nr:hypothetical protein HanHA300_Chr05g0192881 [Helianthus annuus]KAJ0586060.1 hypothetical protein HanHA89_Chr05g0207711 [Helianthus annuus]